jgi:hypothetical protein
MSRLTPEEDAVRAGVRAGDDALARFDASGVLLLFTDQRHWQVSAQSLHVLRAYAEIRRALLPMGHEIPAATLVAAGYTAAEIAQFDATIAGIPAEVGSTTPLEI